MTTTTTAATTTTTSTTVVCVLADKSGGWYDRSVWSGEWGTAGADQRSYILPAWFHWTTHWQPGHYYTWYVIVW